MLRLFPFPAWNSVARCHAARFMRMYLQQTSTMLKCLNLRKMCIMSGVEWGGKCWNTSIRPEVEMLDLVTWKEHKECCPCTATERTCASLKDGSVCNSCVCIFVNNEVRSCQRINLSNSQKLLLTVLFVSYRDSLTSKVKSSNRVCASKLDYKSKKQRDKMLFFPFQPILLTFCPRVWSPSLKSNYFSFLIIILIRLR